jgi:hypothetical protein
MGCAKHPAKGELLIGLADLALRTTLLWHIHPSTDGVLNREGAAVGVEETEVRAVALAARSIIA